MIKEFEFYHGAAFSQLIHEGDENINIKTYPSNSNASYVLNGHIGIYIKHSTKRLSPWRFSMQKVHQDEILEMKTKFVEVFLVLVCWQDGIVTIPFDELKKILNEDHGLVEWISAARNPRKEYSIKGSDGLLERKIGKSNFPKKIIELDLLLRNIQV